MHVKVPLWHNHMHQPHINRFSVTPSLLVSSSIFPQLPPPLALSSCILPECGSFVKDAVCPGDLCCRYGRMKALGQTAITLCMPCCTVGRLPRLVHLLPIFPSSLCWCTRVRSNAQQSRHETLVHCTRWISRSCGKLPPRCAHHQLTTRHCSSSPLQCRWLLRQQRHLLRARMPEWPLHW